MSICKNVFLHIYVLFLHKHTSYTDSLSDEHVCYNMYEGFINTKFGPKARLEYVSS